MDHRVYLGSKSQSRQLLLQEAQIPCVVVDQDADETCCDWNLPFREIVTHICRYKMEHVVLPVGVHGQYCFVLTADTLTIDSNGKVSGKPTDRNDAVQKIKTARNGVITGTAFCLDRKTWCEGSWHVEQRIEGYGQGECVFDVPDQQLDCYLKQPFLYNCAGGIFVEGFGAQFVKTVSGSYSSIIGLPMFEVRQALHVLGFYRTN
jgi:septum formation protein